MEIVSETVPVPAAAAGMEISARYAAQMPRISASARATAAGSTPASVSRPSPFASWIFTPWRSSRSRTAQPPRPMMRPSQRPSYATIEDVDAVAAVVAGGETGRGETNPTVSAPATVSAMATVSATGSVSAPATTARDAAFAAAARAASATRRIVSISAARSARSPRSRGASSAGGSSRLGRGSGSRSRGGEPSRAWWWWWWWSARGWASASASPTRWRATRESMLANAGFSMMPGMDATLAPASRRRRR